MQALKGREERHTHVYAAEVRPESLSRDSAISLFEVNQGCMQPGQVVGLDGAGSVLQVP